jgi:capsule biosynthesis phosphatase
MNYIIPILGEGKRFSDYKDYKPFIKINGITMIERVIEPLLHAIDNNVWIFCNYEYLDNFNKLLNHPRLKIIPLSKTIGAGETIYKACQYLPKNKPFTSVDCDTILKIDCENIIRNVNDNCIFTFKDILKQGIFSYLKTSNNLVLDIVEKKAISTIASSGIYQFKSPQDYISNYNNDIKSYKELYISNVIQYAIKKYNSIYQYIDITDGFDTVGTPYQLKNYIKLNKEIKTFVFDLDKTLIYDTNDNKNVIIKNTEFLNKLYDLGHKIIIHTSRGMKTFDGDLNKIENYYRPIIEKILKDNDINYHQLLFGKPFADFYIDDKSISSIQDLKKETGVYVNEIGESRYMNKIIEKDNLIIKKGNCVKNEIYYYNNIPEIIKKYYPKIYNNDNSNEIIMDKIDGILVSDLLVSGNLSTDLIDKILKSINNIHLHKNIENINDWYYKGKLLDRYKDYESLYLLHGISENEIKNLTNNICIKETSIIHGDTVLTNVFVTKNNEIIFIDPRGADNNSNTIYGPSCYDYAKLLQSLYGYDFILNDSKIPTNYLKKLRNYFFKKCKDDKEQLIYKVKSLILSMLPLHINNDERIKKFVELYKTI